MTALSVALVLCCAMVCGTRLVLVRRRERGQDVAEVARQMEAAVSAGARLEAEVGRMRTELDALKAQSAFRSIE